MSYCKNCGTKLDDGAKFCPKCGTPTDNTPSIENVADGEPNPIKNNDIEHLSQVEQPKKRGCLKKIGIGFLVFCFLGALADKCGNNGSKTVDEANAPQEAEQVVNDESSVEESEPQKQEVVHQDFFEKGYEYSASFRVNRKQGYGLSANYKYNLKIYNDGTTEIVEEIVGDEFPGHPAELYTCQIDKKSESYRDVAASWYEVKFDRAPKSSDILYVDNDGNIIILRVNGNDKTIQEAVTSGDCRFGKFSKNKLDNSKKYICRTCGKEFIPEKQAIVNEEYCYEDYPQTCGTCGKTYTINTDGKSACKGTCSDCSSRHTSVSIYESVTGRKVH